MLSNNKKMIVTLDTNVIFQALYRSSGASYEILELVLNEKLQIALTSSIYFEYYDVLTRESSMEQFNLTLSQVEDFLDLLEIIGDRFLIFYLLRPNLIDESDNHIVECAFVSNSKYLITSNTKHFTTGELKNLNFKVITPGNFIKLWRKENE